MSQIVSLLSQFNIGELKTGWNRLQVKKGEINTGENNPVYSTCSIVYKISHNQEITDTWLYIYILSVNQVGILDTRMHKHMLYIN